MPPICTSSSMVEFLPSKQDVAGSSPVWCSIVKLILVYGHIYLNDWARKFFGSSLEITDGNREGQEFDSLDINLT